MREPHIEAAQVSAGHLAVHAGVDHRDLAPGLMEALRQARLVGQRVIDEALIGGAPAHGEDIDVGRRGVGPAQAVRVAGVACVRAVGPVQVAEYHVASQ
jgi:hypothetical protein